MTSISNKHSNLGWYGLSLPLGMRGVISNWVDLVVFVGKSTNIDVSCKSIRVDILLLTRVKVDDMDSYYARIYGVGICIEVLLG